MKFSETLKDFHEQFEALAYVTIACSQCNREFIVRKNERDKVTFCPFCMGGCVLPDLSEEAKTDEAV